MPDPGARQGREREIGQKRHARAVLLSRVVKTPAAAVDVEDLLSADTRGPVLRHRLEKGRHADSFQPEANVGKIRRSIELGEERQTISFEWSVCCGGDAGRVAEGAETAEKKAGRK